MEWNEGERLAHPLLVLSTANPGNLICQYIPAVTRLERNVMFRGKLHISAHEINQEMALWTWMLTIWK